jgi:Ca2+-binding RTX toxin-like protein
MTAKWMTLMTRLRSSSARRRALGALSAAAAVAFCGVAVSAASADVSHAGWPHTDTVAFAGNGGQVLVGTNGNDMLLGGPGSDTIYGGAGNDIIWGDQHPVPDNPATQADNLYGGPGNDWIYTSHGLNHVYAGTGDDHVFAYFGHGTIDCGPGNDILTLDKSDEHNYTVTNCESIVIGYP